MRSKMQSELADNHGRVGLPASPRGRQQARLTRHTPVAPRQKRLYSASDHGTPVVIPAGLFAAAQRDGGWGPFAESFLRMNRSALEALDVGAELAASSEGINVRLVPGGHTGAIPLRSALTGQVAGGFVVRPRFGWAGVGRVLTEIGWQAAPQFLDLPLVPGSGREVPPWVLAGPVLARFAELLRALRPGYRDLEAVVRQPRGTILWGLYANSSLIRGRWDHLPCRFPDLQADTQLRRMVRWALERVHHDLVAIGGRDPIALALALIAAQLLDGLRDVKPLMPARDDLYRTLGSRELFDAVLVRGMEAIAWVLEERGLGGGRELDGLAWHLPLDRLWEAYVEAIVRRETALTGGEVRVARRGETTFPVLWSNPIHRSLGHLAPDIVVRRRGSVRVFDAKYKAHLAELDEIGWHRFAAAAQEAHRADLHQILAYAALYEAEDITATLIYPLRHNTWQALRERGQDISSADLLRGGRRIRLELRGAPFGRVDPD